MTKKVLVLFCMVLSFLMIASAGTVAFCDDYPVRGEFADVYIEGNSAYVYIDFIKSESDGVMYVAIYSDGGKMKAVERKEFSSGQESDSLQIECNDVVLGDTVKVFFFDTNTGAKPIGKSLYRNIENITLDAIVEGISITDSSLSSNEACLKITDAYGNSQWAEKVGTDVVLEIDKNVDIKEYLGAKVNINLWGWKDEHAVTDMVITDSESRLAFSSADLDVDTTDIGVYYYENDEATRPSRVRLSPDAEIYYNFEQVDSFVDYLRYNGEFDGDAWITMYDNDNDGKYEKVIVNRYTFDVVYESDYEKLSLFYGEIWYEDYADEYTDMRCCGDEIAGEDVIPGDVVQYMTGWSGENIWIIISVYEQNYVVGSVDSVNSVRRTVDIDGTTYKLYFGAGIPDLGEYGRFYLTDMHEVFCYEWETETRYGYVVASDFSTIDFEECWRLKILGSDGETYENRVSDKFGIDGERFYADDSDIPYMKDVCMDNNDNPYQRIISYKEDDNGYISNINFPETYEFEAQEYDSESMTLDGISISDIAVYDITCDYPDEVRVSDMTCLSDGEIYNGIFVSNLNGRYKYLFVTDGLVDMESDYDDEYEDNVQYGYITALGYQRSGFESVWQAKVLTDEGEETYNFKEYFYVGVDEYPANDENCEFLYQIYNSNSPEDRLWEIKINSRNEIAELKLPDMYYFSGYEYDESNNILYRQLSENTVVYNATSGDHTEVTTGDITKLTDGEIYDGFLVKNNNKYPIVVITSGVLSGETEDEEPETDVNYGYVIATAFEDASFDMRWLIRMETESDEYIDYQVADRIIIDGVQYNGTRENNDYLESVQDMNGYNYENRIVSYTLDSQNRINSINQLVLSEFSQCTFDAETNKLGRYKIENNAVVFEIGYNNQIVYSASDLSDIYTYDGFVVYNNSGKHDCVVIINKEICSYTENFAIVSSTRRIEYDGYADAVEITYYGEDGKSDVITFVDDEDITQVYYGVLADDLCPGSIIVFADDGDKIAEYMMVIAYGEDEENTDYLPYNINTEEIYLAIEKDDTVSYVSGAILGIDETESGYELEVSAIRYDLFGEYGISNVEFDKNINMYAVEGNRLKTGDFMDICSVYDEYSETASSFIIKIKDDVVTDIILYIDPRFVVV